MLVLEKGWVDKAKKYFRVSSGREAVEEVDRIPLGIRFETESLGEPRTRRYVEALYWLVWYSQNAKLEMQSLCIGKATPCSHIPQILCASWGVSTLRIRIDTKNRVCWRVFVLPLVYHTQPIVAVCSTSSSLLWQ